MACFRILPAAEGVIQALVRFIHYQAFVVILKTNRNGVFTQ